MKRRIALLLCILMLFALIPAAAAEETPKGNLQINSTNFPDANFREWVKTYLAGGKTSMTSTAVSAVKEIYCDCEDIASLKGIEKFPNLEKLDCSDNKLTSLDLSGNKKLKLVICANNKLTSLKVSACAALETLSCWGNELTSLDVSANKKLDLLRASDNKLKSIDVSKNEKLTTLELDENQLTKLDVSKLTNLVVLSVDSNQLTALDVSKNTALGALYVKWNALTSIDVSKNAKLETLEVFDNQIKSIDVTKNPELRMLNVSENYDVKKLDVTKNTKLLILECANTSISKLDLSKNPKLMELNICETGIDNLDLSKNSGIIYLYAYACLLCEIDVSNLGELRKLDVACNLLDQLDVTNNADLEMLSCYLNEIRYLNLSNNAKLTYLDCANNRLEFLNVRNNPELDTLYCGGNKIRALHLESNTKLTAANASLSPQRTTDALQLTYSDGRYRYYMKSLFETGSEASGVKPFDSSYSYDPSTYYMAMPGNVSEFKYLYDTGKGDMEVDVYRHYSGDFKVELDDWGGLSFKGTTPYMIWNGKKRNAPFTVRNASTDKVIDGYYYDYWYQENVNAGTGYLFVRLWGSDTVKRVWYKIYLPPTTATTVANTSDGIKISWAAVPGAAGYVVYRRAMNLSMSDWSKFDRWNNTTATTFTDTKVYAGTRYQYGVKAYFKQRNDLYAGKMIGGVFDNYNLGLVGPLRTTVRIKTNKLSSVTAGTGKLTAKWTKIDVCTGYQVQIATNSSFTTGKQEVKVTSPSTLSKTISGLTSGKTYYVRVRGYNEFNGTTYYGEWTNVLSCKVK